MTFSVESNGQISSEGTLETSRFVSAVVLWIVNEQSEVLLARRSSRRSTHQGMWGPAVTGTVEDIDRTFWRTLQREDREELGLKAVKPDYRFTYVQSEPPRRFAAFCLRVLKADVDIAYLTLNPEEVEDVTWVSEARLLEELNRPGSGKIYTPLVSVCSREFTS